MLLASVLTGELQLQLQRNNVFEMLNKTFDLLWLLANSLLRFIREVKWRCKLLVKRMTDQTKKPSASRRNYATAFYHRYLEPIDFQKFNRCFWLKYSKFTFYFITKKIFYLYADRSQLRDSLHVFNLFIYLYCQIY